MEGYDAAVAELKRRTTKMPKQDRLIAIDGVGYDDPEGAHHYVVLAASTGEVLIGEPEGLTTTQCFEFLIGLRLTHPDGKFIGYAFKYDSEMILKDVGTTERQELIDQRKYPVKWSNYGLKYLPGQLLQISAHDRLRPDLGHPCIQLFDIQAWFGMTSGDAIYKWLGIDIGEDSPAWWDYDQVPDMVAWVQEKLTLLVDLFRPVWRCAEELGGVRGRVHGPAALAGSWLRANNVKDYLNGVEPREVTEAIRRAFHGPRMQSFNVGACHERLTDCDLRSAFARAYVQLPSLVDGTWRHVDGRPERYVEFALYHVTLNEPGSPKYPGPLPHRDEDKNSSYWTHWAQGWQWGPRAKLVWNNPACTISEAWILEGSETQPFAWVPKVYALRKKSELMDHVIKQSLARIWGKLAQQRGFDYDDDGRVVTPPYHCLAYAGFITAYVDMLLYQGMRAVLDSGAELLGCAIDGFQHTGRAVLVPRDILGGWKTVAYAGGMFLGITQYWLEQADGAIVKTRTRGMTRTALDVDRVREQLAGLKKYDFGIGATDDLDKIKVNETRFIGQGVGMADPKQWRKWVQRPVDFPFGRNTYGDAWHDPLYCPGCRPYLPPSEILHRMTSTALDYSSTEESAPYLMRWERDRKPDPTHDDEVLT